MNWDEITLPLKEGSPVSASGIVSNTEDAIGIVPTMVSERPLMASLYILVGGDVDIAEVEDAYGDELSDAAKSAMAGFRFWKADGTVETHGSGGSDMSPVPFTANGDTASFTYNEFKSVADAGRVFEDKTTYSGVGVLMIPTCYGTQQGGGYIASGIIAMPGEGVVVSLFQASDADVPMTIAGD